MAIVAGLVWLVPRLLGPNDAAGREAATPRGEARAGSPNGASAPLSPGTGETRRPGSQDPDAARESEATREERPRPDLSFQSGGEPPVEDPDRFRGTGVVRGILQVPAGLELPTDVTLELRPGTYTAGREHAVERSLPIADSTSDFRFEDIPFGGYEVGARAPGWNTRWQSLVLERDNPNHYVVLDLDLAGPVEGRLVDALGNPVEGLAVRLEPVPEGEAIEASSDAFGIYRFEAVLDGSYRLIVGHPESPLAPMRVLSVRAPRLSVPTIELGVLLTLEVLVLDAAGIPQPGATVLGSGMDGGRVEGVTNASGALLVPNLPPGEYRLRATVEGVGSSRTRYVLEAESMDEPAVIRLL